MDDLDNKNEDKHSDKRKNRNDEKIQKADRKLNPNIIGVNYSLIALGWGGFFLFLIEC